MAKKHFGTKLFATALATFALASCQSESTLLEPAANNLRDVELTVTVSKGDMPTRTNLDLSDDQKELLLTWNKGDVIQVSETDGTYAGFLTVTDLIEDGKKALFKGTVRTFDKDGEHTFTFASLGKDVEYTAKRGYPMENMVYDFANQTNEGVNGLAKNDLLLANGKVNINGGKATFNDLFMSRQFAYGRFTLLYNGKALAFDANTVVTINTDENDIKTGATLEFPSTITPAGGASISLATSENDFYVTLVPGSSESRLQFKVTVNGVEYEGYSNYYEIVKNDFYRRANGLEKGEALPINVKKTDGSDDTHNFSLIYNANYGSKDTWTDNQEGVGNSYTFTLSEYNKIFDETNEGYTFTGWNTMADGTGVSLLPNSTLTVAYPDGIANVYAQWKENTYDWTIIWKDEDKVYNTDKIEGKASPATYGTGTHKPADPVKEGYTFAGWTYEGKALPSTITLTKDKLEIEIIAKWEKATYDLVVNCYKNDGTNSKTIDRVLNKTLPQTVTADNWDVPTRTGYKFVGWGMTPDATETITSVTFTTPDPINVYAIWKKDVSGGSIVAPGAGGSDY